MESLEELRLSLLKMGINLHKNCVILAGDFYAPGIDWPNLESATQPSSSSERLLQTVDEHDLNQLIKQPTRHQGNTHNILDLVFTNYTSVVGNMKVVPGISDHDIVLFSVKSSFGKKKNVKRKVYIKKKD